MLDWTWDQAGVSRRLLEPDIDFRYINKNGVSFQGEMTNSQFDTQKNQAVYDTAKMFGFTENFQGTANKLNGIKTALGHNDHGHLGFNFNSANIVAR